MPSTATESSDKPGPPWRSGVGLIILNTDNKLLLCRRAGKNDWQLPQGGRDEGETPEQALMRELDEEVGLQPGHIELLARLPNRTEYDFPDYVHAQHAMADGADYVQKYRGQRHDWFVLRLTAPDTTIRFDRHHEVEFDAFRWARPDEAVAAIVGFKQPAYVKAMAMLDVLLGASPQETPAPQRSTGKLSLLTL